MYGNYYFFYQKLFYFFIIIMNTFKKLQKNILYNTLKSENKFVKTLGEGLLKIKQLTSEKDTLDKQKKLKEMEQENLLYFLNGQDTINKLISVDIDPTRFKIVILKNYPYGIPDVTLIKLIIAFKQFIKEIKKSYYKLNTLKLDNIVERFFIYDTLNQPLLLKPTDFSTDLNELYLPNEINSENFSPSHSRTTSTASTINDDNDF